MPLYVSPAFAGGVLCEELLSFSVARLSRAHALFDISFPPACGPRSSLFACACDDGPDCRRRNETVAPQRCSLCWTCVGMCTRLFCECSCACCVSFFFFCFLFSCFFFSRAMRLRCAVRCRASKHLRRLRSNDVTRGCTSSSSVCIDIFTRRLLSTGVFPV